jgi:hypothetical protein
MSSQVPRILLRLAVLLSGVALVCFVGALTSAPIFSRFSIGIVGALFAAAAYLVALASLYIAKSPVPLRSGAVLTFQARPVLARFWYAVLAFLGLGALFVFLSLLVGQHGA